MDICQLETIDQTTISVFVFHPSTINANNRKFILVASPNACGNSILFIICLSVGIAECSYSSKEPQIQYYSNRGYFVVAYDYRGYGGSLGSVTPENTIHDAKTIIDYMNVEYNVSLELVHGTSIGGYVVSGISKLSPLVIYDRNFVNMNAMVGCLVCRFQLCFHSFIHSFIHLINQ